MYLDLHTANMSQDIIDHLMTIGNAQSFHLTYTEEEEETAPLQNNNKKRT